MKTAEICLGVTFTFHQMKMNVRWKRSYKQDATCFIKYRGNNVKIKYK